jgi:pimeloyl-ACP methyl ester carboxylesterase
LFTKTFRLLIEFTIALHFQKDVRLHYVTKGDENNQTMLFIHGFPEFWYSWRHQIREFAKDYHVIAVDSRGYGDSDKPNGIHNYTVDKLVDDIRELLTALNRQQVVLVGHDWGAIISWTFAAKYPELLDRLVIMNGSHPKHFQDVMARSWRQFFSSWYKYFFNLPLLPELVLLSNDLSLLEEFMKSADGHTMCTAEDVEAYKYVFSKYNSLTCPLNYYRAVIRKYRCELPRSYHIKVPALVIWGQFWCFVCLVIELRF